jgi:hypothetical protein
VVSNISVQLSQTPLPQPLPVIGLAAVAAALLIQGSTPAQAAALVCIAALVVLTMKVPWLGVLALFPLAVSVAAPPESVGIKEVAFAGLTACVLARSVIGALVQDGWKRFLQDFGIPLGLAAALLAANFLAALYVGTSVPDWVRGAIPYLFLVMAVPIALELRGRPERMRWLGFAIIAAIMLLCLYVLGYYIAHRMWDHEWHILVDGAWVRVTEDVAKQNLDIARGPLLQRITMNIASSTDALVPLGVSLGFCIAVMAENRQIRWLGLVLTALAVPSVLVTYTRSMLLSALLVIFAFGLYVLLFQRHRLRFATWLLIGLTVYAVAVIFALGLEMGWLSRVLLLLATISAWTVERAILAWVWLVNHYYIAMAWLEYAFYVVRDWLLATVSVPPAIVAQQLSETDAVQWVAAFKQSGWVSQYATGDANVTTRLEEYQIAWKMFLDHPIFGNGLGSRHAIVAVRNVGEFLPLSVGYIHNWPLYMLMAGGIVGFAAYATLLVGPICAHFKGGQADIRTNLLVRILPATLAIYGLFFAVARLITFNLLIAAVWGILIASGATLLRSPRKG